MANRRIPSNPKTGTAKDTACAFLFMTGILLAGSDGSWFPWINLFGLFLFSLVPVFCIPAPIRDRLHRTGNAVFFRPCLKHSRSCSQSCLTEPTGAHGGAV